MLSVKRKINETFLNDLISSKFTVFIRINTAMVLIYPAKEKAFVNNR